MYQLKKICYISAGSKDPLNSYVHPNLRKFDLTYGSYLSLEREREREINLEEPGQGGQPT
jgi:hypothetical protein